MNRNKFWKLAVAACALSFASALIWEFYESNALYGDYELVRTNGQESGNYQSLRTNGPAVRIASCYGTTWWRHAEIDGDVQLLAKKKPYVTGFTSALNGESGKGAKDRVGYFLLNCKTRDRQQGLTEHQWKLALERVGWQNPKLEKP